MPHASKQEEELRSSNEAGWATLGREMADHGLLPYLLRDAAARRNAEQTSADRATMFAALARQIADAYLVQRPLGPLITELQALRKREATGL